MAAKSEHLESNIAPRTYRIKADLAAFSVEFPGLSFYDAVGQAITTTTWGSRNANDFIKTTVEGTYNGFLGVYTYLGYIYAPTLGIVKTYTLSAGQKLYSYLIDFQLNENCFNWDISMASLNVYIDNTLTEVLTVPALSGSQYTKALNDSRISQGLIIASSSFQPTDFNCPFLPPRSDYDDEYKISVTAIGGWQWLNGITYQSETVDCIGSGYTLPTPPVISSCGTLTCEEAITGYAGTDTFLMTAEGQTYLRIHEKYPIPCTCRCPDGSIVTVNKWDALYDGHIQSSSVGSQPIDTTGLNSTHYVGKTSRTCYWPLLGNDQAIDDIPVTESHCVAYVLANTLKWTSTNQCGWPPAPCPDTGSGGSTSDCDPAFEPHVYCVYNAEVQIFHPDPTSCESKGSPALDSTAGMLYRAYINNGTIWFGKSANTVPRQWEDEETQVSADWVRIIGQKQEKDPWIYAMYYSGGIQYTKFQLGSLNPGVGDIHTVSTNGEYGDFTILRGGEKYFAWLDTPSGKLYVKAVDSVDYSTLLASTQISSINPKAGKRMAVECFETTGGVETIAIAVVEDFGGGDILTIYSTTDKTTFTSRVVVANYGSIDYCDMIIDATDRRVYVYYSADGVPSVRVYDTFFNLSLAESSLTGVPSGDFCVRDSNGGKGSHWIEYLDSNLTSYMSQQVTDFV